MRFLLLLLLILWSLSPKAHGEEGRRWDSFADTVFVRIANDSGVPNTLGPTAICEDGDGFLWVGSQNGLTRWDGYHFRQYHNAEGHPESLPDNIVQVLHRDPGGRLWIGTAAHGLLRYDAEHDRFVPYGNGPNGLSHVSVMALADAGGGNLWVGTEGGLDFLDVSRDKVAHVRWPGDAGQAGGRVQLSGWCVPVPVCCGSAAPRASGVWTPAISARGRRSTPG